MSVNGFLSFWLTEKDIAEGTGRKLREDVGGRIYELTDPLSQFTDVYLINQLVGPDSPRKIDPFQVNVDSVMVLSSTTVNWPSPSIEAAAPSSTSTG
jgi:hypothetical protein